MSRTPATTTILAMTTILAILIACTTATAQPATSPHGDLSTDCKVCHADESWESGAGPMAFDHSATGFPLSGDHRGTACALCHHSLVFADVGALCADCHTDNHLGTLGNDCAQCHTPNGWENRTLMRTRHDETAFPLRGSHGQADCDACHTGVGETVYVGTPIDCYSCHAADYHATTSPAHGPSGYDHDCTLCHDPFGAGWIGRRFLHPASYPLIGAHAVIDCTACHTEGFTSLPTDCASCHQADYDAAVNPDHQAADFPVDCVACHNTRAWEPSSYDHGVTSFTLTGAHGTVDCLSCHAETYAGTPVDCETCHQPDYDDTTDPEHIAAGFPTDCILCHGTAAWDPSDYDHGVTAFPLTGAHTTADCLSCHADGYTGTLPVCVACHQDDYDATTEPGHLAADIPTSCVDCHGTAAWTPAEFDHGATTFPLTGAHRTVDCLSCHGDGYTNTPTDCIACHQDDYDATTEPGHFAAGFPTSCVDCHGTSAWTPADWDHDRLFPIYTGRHNDEWNTCADCHVTASDFQVFECIFCHEHDNETDLNGRHREVGDYQYLSSACFDCHPRGEEED